MKPHHTLALCAFLDAALQLASIRSGTFSITGFIGLLIAIALLMKDKFSFRAYRFYLWVGFFVTLFFTLSSMFGWTKVPMVKGNIYSALHIPPFLVCLVWAAASAALLYYTDKDEVRRAFRLPPKDRSNKVDDEEAASDTEPAE